MYVFLASPFSQFCEGDEDIIIKDRWFFEEIIKNLKNNNIDYFCSQEREAWGEKYNIKIKEEYVQDNSYEPGAIIKQSKQAGSKVVSGMSITITIAEEETSIDNEQ